ncbi:Coatomer subunit gamma-2 [Monoraphidium neglectum]|uniref:Coatomer subunit gamma-2 n=1 Tax=Monoraphidium neglectum TaxID=145388 RepID=A0A0D2M847_9CHLO|nr:Coatomer subunit gamma-2 [Monoraphidium neglectum]KIY91625.1 Coatomer subunit gamma-2 [Monoraphidium neglectum]|eukprot:XP_013890645.1 Coatomer subunit gamma-2 [Monoraphidium neglectum]
MGRREIPDAKEAGLAHLCEFIEDCEFTFLSCQILHLLGREGPGTKEPARYIRFIFNRVILENATVRAAAVSALARFGAAVEGLRPRVVVLLRRALFDNDDEVRDRATLHLSQLAGHLGGPEALLQAAQRRPDPSALELQLKAYLAGDADEEFDLVRAVRSEIAPATLIWGAGSSPPARARRAASDIPDPSREDRVAFSGL